jgi:hypothetical protein
MNWKKPQRLYIISEGLSWSYGSWIYNYLKFVSDCWWLCGFLRVLWCPLHFYGYSGFLYLLQVLPFPLPPTGTLVSSTFYRYSGFLYILQVLPFPLPSTGTLVSSTFYRYSGFLYILQVLWFPLPSTGTLVSSTTYRYSGFLYLLHVLLFPLPSTGAHVSSTFYRYSRFLYLLQVLWFPLPSTCTLVSSTFYRKPKYPQETTDQSQVTHKLSHKLMLYQVHPAMSEIQIHNFSGDGHWLHMYYIYI